jgi:plastocyanin
MPIQPTPLAPTQKPASAVDDAELVGLVARRDQPASLTVRVGDSVVWVNKDPFPHTVTSAGGGFDSHEIAPGKSWKYAATKKGEFPYVCIFHSTMKATLHVE